MTRIGKLPTKLANYVGVMLEDVWRSPYPTVLVGVAALSLGWWGFNHFPGYGNYSQWEYLYRTLQLFVFGGNLNESPPLSLQCARFMAIFVSTFTAAKALCKVLGIDATTWLVRKFSDDHIVVCGLGRKGFYIAMHYADQGARVIILERDEKNEYVELVRDGKCIVRFWDATREKSLRRVSANRAKLVFATCGNDLNNIEIGSQLLNLSSTSINSWKGSDQNHHRTWWLHVVDPTSLHALKALVSSMSRRFTEPGHRQTASRQASGSRESSQKVNFKVFNIYDICARRMLLDYPLDRRYIDEKDRTVVWLVIIGFGRMGESVGLWAARLGHFANFENERLQILVVDKDADAREQSFRARYPYYKHACDWKFRQTEIERTEILADLIQLAEDKNNLVTIAVCLDGDARCFDVAQLLASMLPADGARILARIERQSGLSELLRDSDIRPFGQIKPAIETQLDEENELDELAKTIHDKYVEKSVEKYEPSTQEWDILEEDLKDSNRQQADHMYVKMRAIQREVLRRPSGRDVSKLCSEELQRWAKPDDSRDRVAEIDSEDALLLAKMEHQRWCAERWLDGWSFGETKDVLKKKSPFLTEWEKIPKDVRQYDLNAVNAIPRLLERRLHKHCKGSNETLHRR